MTKEQKIGHLRNIQLIKELGFAGIDKTGSLVDRRTNPNAKPLKENKKFGIPKPKEI